MSKIIRLLCIAVLTRCFMGQIGPNTQLDNPDVAKDEHPDGLALGECPEEKEIEINNNPDNHKFVVCKTPASVVAAILKAMKEESITTPKRGSSTPLHFTAINDAELASDRYKPLCRVFFRHDTTVLGFLPRTKKASCSCAFIGPSLVITAAHCFTALGVKCKAEGKKPWVVEVVQQYGLGGEANHAKHMKTHRRLVTRWWYSKYFYRSTDKRCNLEHDFAFMETNEPSVGGKFYKFQPLDYNKQVGELHKNGDKPILESVGYPGNYLNSEVAVRVTGEYEVPLAFMQFQLVQRVEGKEHVAGNGRGASGGPILFNEESLKKIPNERKEKEMWLLGINSNGNDDDKHFPTYTRSPQFLSGYAFKAKDIKLPAEAKAAAATDPLEAPENVESIVIAA